MLDEKVESKDQIKKSHPELCKESSVADFLFLILSLFLFTSCTDYVQQINEQKEDFLALQEDCSESSATSDVDESVKTSSSSVKQKLSSSSKSKSSSSIKSSGSTKSSSSTKFSSSGKNSGSSSSKGLSSSAKKVSLRVSGKCELLMPDVVHVGDEVVWRYQPDEGSKDSAPFEWDLNNEVEKSIVDGVLTGNGVPEITVVFKTAGKKFGPGIYFDGEYFDCENLTVYAKESISSSNERKIVSSSSVGYVSPSSVKYGNFEDDRDGQIYKTVTIGFQTWMAENLNYESENSYCYNNRLNYCEKYGRLYTWTAAETACPSGWHLPMKVEFETLFIAIGGQSAAGSKLKSTIGLNNNGNCTDDYSFSVLLAGYRDISGNFFYEGYDTFFWSSSEYNSFNAYNMYINYDTDIAKWFNSIKDYGLSVRCVKD